MGELDLTFSLATFITDFESASIQILLNIMSLDIDIIYTNDIFWLQSSDTTFGALLYLALF